MRRRDDMPIAEGRPPGRLRYAVFGLLLLAAGCATEPPPPAWRAEAKGWLDTALDSYLRGDTRAAEAALTRARAEIASSGRLDLAARAELSWCAVRTASAVYEPCSGFEALRADAGEDLRAYAGYIEGKVDQSAASKLPEAHRPLASGRLAGAPAAAHLRTIPDPLSRLVALGVLFKSGRADFDAISIGVDTASERGWRRPLLAWLTVQAAALEHAGKTQAASAVRRRIEFVGTGRPL